MDLKVKDVAGLLNVSEKTIEKWLSEGKIPAYQIEGQYRFSRLEIEPWVIDHHLDSAKGESLFDSRSKTQNAKTANGSQTFSLYRAIHKGEVLNQVTGRHKEQVIRFTTKSLSRFFKVDSDVLAELLIQRENLQATALNNGIAVPHTRDFILNPLHDLVTIAFPEKPIPYGALDRKPVHTLFFLFACNDKRHLHLLAKIAHLSSLPETIAFLKTKPSKEAFLEYVKEWESHIPGPEES